MPDELATDDADGEDTEPDTDDTTDENIDDERTFDAKYVRKLRDEAAHHRREKAALERELTELRQYRVERTLVDEVGPILRDPSDLRTFGKLDECFGDDGSLDPERVKAAARALKKERPYLGHNSDGDQGARGATLSSGNPVGAFSDLLRGAAQT